MKKIISVICILLSLTITAVPVSAAKKDTKAPVITKTNPVDCATDIMIEDEVVIRFSENVKKGKAIAKISLKESDLKDIGLTYVLTDNLLKITPKAKLKYDTIYTLTIPALAVKDAAGNNLTKTFILTFITENDPSEAVDSTEKQNGLKYILEIEAVFDSELTQTKIAYFTELMKMFGIDATFLNVYEADQADQNKEQDTSSSTGDKCGNPAGTDYTCYILLLKAPGPDKAQVIKTISRLADIPLSEAKKLADGAPAILLKNITLKQAEAAEQELEALNASVSVIGIE